MLSLTTKQFEIFNNAIELKQRFEPVELQVGSLASEVLNTEFGYRLLKDEVEKQLETGKEIRRKIQERMKLIEELFEQIQEQIKRQYSGREIGVEKVVNGAGKLKYSDESSVPTIYYTAGKYDETISMIREQIEKGQTAKAIKNLDLFRLSISKIDGVKVKKDIKEGIEVRGAYIEPTKVIRG